MAKERVARVFGVESEYEHIREKIVGTVFHYNPDTKKVMSNLMKKTLHIIRMTEDSLKKILIIWLKVWKKRNMLISVPSNFFYKKWISCFRYWTVRITKI